MSSFRRLIASLLALLVIAAILPFVLPLGKDGKPLLEPPKFALPSAPELPNIDPGQWLAGEEQDNEVTVYRWQDEQGQWHYGEQPPEGVAYEERTLDTDANLIQALPPASPPTTAPSLGGRLGESLEQARGVEGTLQQSHEQRMRQLDGQ